MGTKSNVKFHTFYQPLKWTCYDSTGGEAGLLWSGLYGGVASLWLPDRGKR